MARTLQVVLVDDLDGGDATQTVSFALDGASYEIDLSDANAARLRDDLAVWVGHARRTGRGAGSAAGAGGAGGGRSGDGPGQGQEAAAVRAWARANGHTLNERGRVPRAVLDAYREARQRDGERAGG